MPCARGTRARWSSVRSGSKATRCATSEFTASIRLMAFLCLAHVPANLRCQPDVHVPGGVGATLEIEIKIVFEPDVFAGGCYGWNPSPAKSREHEPDASGK